MTLLSVIIPCHNEVSGFRERLISILSKSTHREIIQFIVADSSYNLSLKKICDEFDVEYFSCNIARRATQMNMGATKAIHQCLFFLHIDSTPPYGFDLIVNKAIQEGHQSGCFRLLFDESGLFFRFFAGFTRFRWTLARGGDQGLFITKALFIEINGFREDMAIMEDIDICKRLMKLGDFAILKEQVTTSARKYKAHGPCRLQLIFGYLHLLYWLGYSNKKLHSVYREYISP